MKAFIFVAVMIFLAGCSGLPTQPTVLVLPGTDKNLTQFHADDILCRQFAHRQVVTSSTERDEDDDQQLYDMSYMQCMYEKGHRVPVPGAMSYQSLQEWHAPPPADLPPPR